MDSRLNVQFRHGRVRPSGVLYSLPGVVLDRGTGCLLVDLLDPVRYTAVRFRLGLVELLPRHSLNLPVVGVRPSSHGACSWRMLMAHAHGACSWPMLMAQAHDSWPMLIAQAHGAC